MTANELFHDLEAKLSPNNGSYTPSNVQDFARSFTSADWRQAMATQQTSAGDEVAHFTITEQPNAFDLALSPQTIAAYNSKADSDLLKVGLGVTAMSVLAGKILGGPRAAMVSLVVAGVLDAAILGIDLTTKWNENKLAHVSIPKGILLDSVQH